MWAVEVVEVEVACQSITDLAGRSVIIEVHLLILDGAPEAFGENIIRRSPAAVHADLDPRGRQTVKILWADEMATLIAVPDGWDGLPQGSVYGAQHKREFQGLVPFPGDNIAREPIQNGDQVHPAAPQANVSGIDAPQTWLG